MGTEDRKSMERREFLRKAAATGAVAAWAAPIVQSVAATPAFAQTSGTPGACFHSIDEDEGKLRGCMEACQGSGQGCGAACNQQCQPACRGPGNLCCRDEYCDPAFWSNCTYTGPTC